MARKISARVLRFMISAYTRVVPEYRRNDIIQFDDIYVRIAFTIRLIERAHTRGAPRWS